MLKVLRLAWSFSDKNSNSTDLYGRVSYFNVEGLESLFGVTNKPNKATPWWQAGYGFYFWVRGFRFGS